MDTFEILDELEEVIHALKMFKKDVEIGAANLNEDIDGIIYLIDILKKKLLN